MVRSSVPTAVVLIATLFGAGCAQTSFPTSPSSAASFPVSGSTSPVQAASTDAPLLAECSSQSTKDAPLLARLGVVHNALVLTNFQLNLYLSLPPEATEHWTGRAALEPLDNTENTLPEYHASCLTFPLNAQVRDALNGIIAVANITLDLLKGNNFPQSPVIAEIQADVQLIVLTATSWLSCQKAPCL